jgi:hypothetical protein
VSIELDLSAGAADAVSMNVDSVTSAASQAQTALLAQLVQAQQLEQNGQALAQQVSAQFRRRHRGAGAGHVRDARLIRNRGGAAPSA